MPVVRLEYRNVTMRFADAKGGGALTAVRGVSFSIRDAEVVSLIGPTGCGKSTLLNIGSGLAAPSEGAAFVDGVQVAGPNAQVAFMLQKDLLLPWRTIVENVMFGVEIQGVPLAGRRGGGRKSFWEASTSPIFPAIIRIICRAACASAWRWRARLLSTRTCFSSTS